MKVAGLKGGAVVEVEIDVDTLDFKSMGVLSRDEVDEFAKRKTLEGANKAKTEFEQVLAQAQKERDELKVKLEENSSGMSAKEREALEKDGRLAQLETTLRTLTEKMTQTEQEKTKAIIAKEIADVRSDLRLVAGASEIFDGYMANRRQADGQYLLSNGLKGTAQEARAEWVGSEVGKSLLLSSERGGSNSSTTPVNRANLGDAKAKAEYIKQHGLEAYKAQLNLSK